MKGVSRVPASKSHHLDRTSRAAFAGYSLFSHGDGFRLIVVALALARGTCPISGSRFPKQQRERVPSFPVQDKILQCKGKGGLSHRLRQQGGANITSEHGGSSTTVHSCDAERRYADDERSRVVRGVTWSGSRQQVRLPRRESYSPLKSRATSHFFLLIARELFGVEAYGRRTVRSSNSIPPPQLRAQPNLTSFRANPRWLMLWGSPPHPRRLSAMSKKCPPPEFRG